MPGAFLDVNPRELRPGESPLATRVRFSFGPPEENVRTGLDRLQQMIASA